jgi:2-hydroxychromene-2-carboxylate isomerase
MSMRIQPVLYYDLGSPEAYVAAEGAADVLGVVPEWQPIQLARLPGAGELDAFRCAEERDIFRAELERRAAIQRLQPLRWPPDWPNDTALAMRVATYARSIGRVVAFSLAAFRQAFAAGRDLSDPDSVVIAAAACEMHPAAVLKAAETRGVADALARATAAAGAAGVRGVPAVRVGDRVFHGVAELDAAASALREAPAA